MEKNTNIEGESDGTHDREGKTWKIEEYNLKKKRIDGKKKNLIKSNSRGEAAHREIVS